MKAKRTPVMKLREAAQAWALALAAPMVDSQDSAFKRVDKQLQRAALAYARTQAVTR